MEGNSTYRNMLLNLLEENDLVDIWRFRHQDKHQYTWRGISRAGLVQSRLDFLEILAKTLANRLQKVIGYLISADQVGYIKGRFIGENVCIIEDMIQYTNKNDIPGLLVLIDFEKVFETIEWDFLFKTLKSYNFGKTFIDWIKLLYSNITACTINNGYLSHNFTLERGIRQGCPSSAILFILVAEILSINLRSNQKAKDITIDGLEYKITQLADDTAIFTKDLYSVQAFIAGFKHFENVSGLKLNLDKSEIIPLGPLCRFVIPTEINMLKVNKKAFKTLGIWFSCDLNECESLNLQFCLENIKMLLRIWKHRKLSWIGQIMIVKTRIVPQITHLLSTIYIPDYFLQELDGLLYGFLWNDKIARVKKETVTAQISEGGLKMINIYSFHIAQKAMWVKRLVIDSTSKWSHLFR